MGYLQGDAEELERVVDQLRGAWPVVRADSSFAREAILAWCEGKLGVDYVFGLAKKPRLSGHIEAEMEQARRQRLRSGESSRA